MNNSVLIIGAGAAGLMCAIEAAKTGKSVTILEHNRVIGKKLRASGGGRCNFTNKNTCAKNYLCNDPRFPEQILSAYSPENFCRKLEQHRLPYHEKQAGQLFCNRGADSLAEMLIKECSCYQVKIITAAAIQKVSRIDSGFEVITGQGPFLAKNLVVASGGLSYPALGATDLGYRIARQFGHRVIACRPGLSPLTWDSNHKKIFSNLSGVTVDATVRFKGHSFADQILFTHQGLSGPGILQISSYVQPKDIIQINLLPGKNISRIFRKYAQRNLKIKNFLAEFLPARLAQVFVENFFWDKTTSACAPAEIEHLEKILHSWQVPICGIKGYEKAEVTVGGVDTAQLSGKNLESRKVPGLYFIGEIVDVTGQLGGYNLQWAWASGYAAGSQMR